MASGFRTKVLGRNGGLCIYCSSNAATTIDHMPPISMFTRRERPSGLEFPSCEGCNRGARHADLVAALVGRAFSDPLEGADGEFQGLLRAISQEVPEALLEMRPPRAHVKLAMRRLGLLEGGGLRLDGPVVSGHLEAFAARLGLAMHFEHTGLAVPPTGGVAVRVYSNLEVWEGKTPPELADLLPPPKTLRQGRKSAEGQFLYAARPTDGGRMTLSAASFRQSFAVLAISTDDRSRLSEEGVHMHLPGALSVRPRFSRHLAFSVYGTRWRAWPTR